MSFIQELFTSRNNGADGADFVGKQGRIWWDPTTNCFYYSDGITPGGIPIGAGAAPAYGEMATETYPAIASQTQFTLVHTPVGQVTGSINGATIVADALAEAGASITYDPALNDGYIIRDGDVVTFSYLYGTVGPSSLGNLGDVRLTTPRNGQALIYDGASNQWVAGNPGGALQSGIQNDSTIVRIWEPDADVKFTIAGIQDKMTVGLKGINLMDAGYYVNGYLAVNGPTIQIENKNSEDIYDACDRPIVVPYNQVVPTSLLTTVEYARLCWDTANKFNPTDNPIIIGGEPIAPWSWKPIVDGYYEVTARLTLDRTLLPSTTTGTEIVTKQFTAMPNQLTFNILKAPKGSVVFCINGATVPASAVTVSGTIVTYVPANNSDYVLQRDDSVGISYVLGGNTPGLTMNSESVVATADQTSFTLANQPTGILMASLNGATLQVAAFIVTGTSAEYLAIANDDYVLRDDDVVTFTYLSGTSGNKILINESYYTPARQVVFPLTEYPSGTVIASLNGAVLPPAATQLNGKNAIYLASGNDGYIIRAGDVMTYTYIGPNTRPGASAEWATLSIVVNGVVKSTGCRATWIGDTIDIEVDTILLISPTDNVSIQVYQNTDTPLPVLTSTLSASMIRGIE